MPTSGVSPDLAATIGTEQPITPEAIVAELRLTDRLLAEDAARRSAGQVAGSSAAPRDVLSPGESKAIGRLKISAVALSKMAAENALESLVHDLLQTGDLDRANKVRFHMDALRRALDGETLKLTVGPTAYVCPFCAPLGDTAFPSVADCNAHIRSKHPERAALLDLKGAVRVVGAYEPQSAHASRPTLRGIPKVGTDPLDQRTPDTERDS